MKYRKKSVSIEATQWFKNGDHPQDYARDSEGIEDGRVRIFSGSERKANGWEGGIVRYFRRPDVDGASPCRQCGIRMHEHGWIDTLEGGYIVCPGDFIITGVHGEHYPCKPDIFGETYSPETCVIRDPKNCAHEHFSANVDVNRLKDSGRFCADVSIACSQCGTPFRFLGLPCGLDLNGAAVSPDGCEARLAIGTPETVANILDGDCPVGFTVRKGE